MKILGWFRQTREERPTHAHWRNVAESTVFYRKQMGAHETLRDGAIDALAIAGVSAQERGLPLDRIIDHVQAAYHDYTIERVPDEYPCDPWPCSLIVAVATSGLFRG